eukprot:UN19022
MLEFDIAFRKSIHFLHFKLLIFFKIYQSRWSILSETLRNSKNYPFITFPIADFLQNYRIEMAYGGQTLRVDILQFRLQISNFTKVSKYIVSDNTR